MIDLENKLIKVPGKPPEPIKNWSVYFVTIEGSFGTLDEAHASCERTLQPKHTIVPLPVAIGDTLFEISLTAGAIFEAPDNDSI